MSIWTCKLYKGLGLLALTLTLAAYVKTAFGGTAQPSDPTDQPVDRQAAEQVSAPRHPGMEEAAPPVEFAELDEGQPLITGSLPGEDGDMGRIGRGPGQLDLSRFFPDADPTMDRPDLYLADRPEIALDGLIGRPLAEIERLVIEETIARHGGSVPKAARALDIAPSTIYRKIESWSRRDDPAG
jgi:hypothetical protein